MLFKRTHDLNIKSTDADCFRYLDSVTGLMNRQICFKEHERLKASDKYSAVTVRLSGCEDMIYRKALEKIRETGELIARICSENISRLENGDFVIFTQNGEETAAKLAFFLEELAEEERIAISCDELDINEDFDTFVRRIQRHVAVAAGSSMMKCCKIPKNT